MSAAGGTDEADSAGGGLAASYARSIVREHSAHARTIVQRSGRPSALRTGCTPGELVFAKVCALPCSHPSATPTFALPPRECHDACVWVCACACACACRCASMCAVACSNTLPSTVPCISLAEASQSARGQLLEQQGRQVTCLTRMPLQLCCSHSSHRAALFVVQQWTTIQSLQHAVPPDLHPYMRSGDESLNPNQYACHVILECMSRSKPLMWPCLLRCFCSPDTCAS